MVKNLVIDYIIDWAFKYLRLNLSNWRFENIIWKYNFKIDRAITFN